MGDKSIKTSNHSEFIVFERLNLGYSFSIWFEYIMALILINAIVIEINN